MKRKATPYWDKTIRISLTLQRGVVKKLDEHADAHDMTRSAMANRMLYHELTGRDERDEGTDNDAT